MCFVSRLSIERIKLIKIEEKIKKTLLTFIIFFIFFSSYKYNNILPTLRTLADIDQTIYFNRVSVPNRMVGTLKRFCDSAIHLQT